MELKVFEAFSGVGSQRMALRNINKKFKVVATSEIDKNAIIAYNSVHCQKKTNVPKLSKQSILEYLNKKGIGNKTSNQRMTYNDLVKLYLASEQSKNLGDITKIDNEIIPEHDIFTYSFPCQDISTLGTGKGLDKDSGTRSSLLWECERIIENKKPKYLILENVKALTTGKNKHNFEKWLKYLDAQGYDNYWRIFDSQHYGIPQRRPRVFVVSKLGKSKSDLVKNNKVTKIKTINDIIDYQENRWKLFIPKAKIKGEIQEGECLFLDDRDWKMNGIMIHKISSTQRAGRTGLKCIKKENNILYERKLNGLECCRLMGYNDEDYYNMKNSGLSETSIMKICGNSIVVNILEMIFLNIYEEETYD